MAKKRGKCEHDNDSITLQGCPHCVTNAMLLLGIIRAFKCSPEELLDMMRQRWVSMEEWNECLKNLREVKGDQ